MSYAQSISQAYMALERARESGTAQVAAKWEARIEQLMEAAPSGSGFDNGTKLVEATDAKMAFSTAFHHMNEHGYYCEWTYHKVVVTATFFDFDIRVTGRDTRGIKEFIGDVFHAWLKSDAPILDWGKL